MNDAARRDRSAVHWHTKTSAEIAALADAPALVIVPVGSIEQHGPHLRLHEDVANALALAEAAAVAAPSPVLVAPPVWWGMAPHHMGFAGTISLRFETLTALISDICVSIASHGFRRILLLNGHGGNASALVAIATQLSADEGLFVSTVSYWSLIPDVLESVGTSEIGGMGHAGEMETSIAMHLRPATVVSDRLAADIPGSAGGLRAIDFRAPGPVAMPLDLRRDTAAGVIGDPTVATAEKGERIVAALIDRLVAVIDDLATVPTWPASPDGGGG